MLEDVKKDANERMNKCVAALKNELKKVRTGRAHTSLLEHIRVEYYGNHVPLNQVANLGVEDYHDNCSDNLRMALFAIGEHTTEVPQPFNIWMNIPVQADGSIDWLPTVSKPGDQITLRAEMDCIIVLSACPQDMVPINGPDMTPVELDFKVTA